MLFALSQGQDAWGVIGWWCHQQGQTSDRTLGEASDRVARAGGTYVVRVPHLDKPETKRGSRTEAISRMRRQLTELYVKLRVPYLLNNRRRVPTQRHDRVAMVGVYTQAPPSLTGFSFSPGGLLFPYHLGVATSLAYHKRITDETHLAVSAKAVNWRAAAQHGGLDSQSPLSTSIALRIRARRPEPSQSDATPR